MKGELDLMGPAMGVANELMAIPDFGDAPDNVFEQYRTYVKNMKKAVLLVAGAAVQKLMMELAKEQEVLMNIADMVIDTYVAESVLLRTEKRVQKLGEEVSAAQIAMMQTFIADAADRIHKAGKDALYSFAGGDELRMMSMGLRRFCKTEALNVRDTRRLIAARLISENKYCF